VGENFLRGHERFGLEAGIVMRALRAIPTVLAARTGLDAEQRAKLHLAPGPMPLVRTASLRNEIKKRTVINFLELRERLFHWAAA
jgi:hypothetical protein